MSVVRGSGWLLVCVTLLAAPNASDVIAPRDVTAHVEQVIAWYRDVNALAPPAIDVLVSDNLHATSFKTLQLAFTFARAESVLLGSTPGAQNTPGTGSLQEASTKADDRVTSVQSKIAGIDSELPKAVGKRQEILTAQKNELNAELALAKEIQATLQNVVNFTGSIDSKGGALAMQIDELERSVPEVAGKNPQPTANTKTSTTVFSPETAGVLSLASELFDNHNNRAHLSDLLKTTQTLADGIDKLKSPLINQWTESTQRSDQLANQPTSDDPKQLAAAQHELDSLVGQFKQLSTAIVPLGEEGIALGTAQNYLQESISTLDQRSKRAGSYLLVKAITLAVVIFVVLFVGEIWRRATFRYVRDARRRRQFLLLRRVVIAGTVSLAVVFWFVSELGSLATYAGFVTAGVAVALQSPILSVVAYFFLIGRYGLRVGDRVTISNVTGEVIEIGLVRIYLAELTGTGPDLHPTGRVVVFSNSVIFQPSSALYRQMPGIDYVWHTAVVTLTPESDFQLAEKTLNAAVDTAYAKYEGDIARQYASLEQAVDVHIPAPKPESRLRFTEAGLQYAVRYPAEIARAIEMDNQILLGLHDAVQNEPKLSFASGGEPKLQP
jgi:small-conductance mechanosensitive channel